MSDKEKIWLLAEKYHGEKTEGFFADCARLEAGEPLAYVIGHMPFLNTTIYLDLPQPVRHLPAGQAGAGAGQAGSRPLIPRPETEFWIENAIEEIRDNHHEQRATEGDAKLLRRGPAGHGGACEEVLRSPSTIHILDLCAGSGCIGVAVAKAIPEVHVDFAEIDVHHHATILKNIKENDITENRTAIFGGDLFSEIPEGTRYNYILTNPPYIDPELAKRTEKSVTDYEPTLALWGGEKGLECIYRIISDASRFLAEDGVLYIEHDVLYRGRHLLQGSVKHQK